MLRRDKVQPVGPERADRPFRPSSPYEAKARVAPPDADFSADDTTPDTGATVTFTDASTESPTSWVWTFGDGDTSTAQNPTHVYAAAGQYTVRLLAVNAGGSNQEIKANYLTVTDP